LASRPTCPELGEQANDLLGEIFAEQANDLLGEIFPKQANHLLGKTFPKQANDLLDLCQAGKWPACGDWVHDLLGKLRAGH
jgi:hypothetical protein